MKSAARATAAVVARLCLVPLQMLSVALARYKAGMPADPSVLMMGVRVRGGSW